MSARRLAPPVEMGNSGSIVGNDIRPRAEQTLAISYVVDGTRRHSTLYVLCECRIANQQPRAHSHSQLEDQAIWRTTAQRDCPRVWQHYTSNDERNTRYLTAENTLFTNETAPISAWSWWQKR